VGRRRRAPQVKLTSSTSEPKLRPPPPAARADMSSGLIAEDVAVKRMVRIRRTVMCMLRDRGYLVVEHELSMNRRDFERKYGESFHREDMLINKCKKNDPNDQVSSARPNLPCFPLPASHALVASHPWIQLCFSSFVDGHPRPVSRSICACYFVRF
jgi:hypothetical protein